MADQNTNQPTFDSSANPMDVLNGNELGQVITKAVTQAFQQNPNLFNNNVNASRESQSNYVGNKWTFSREKPGQQKQEYRSRGNLLEDFENGIKDQLLDSLTDGTFKGGIQAALNTFQEEFGWNLKNIGHEAGKQLMGKVGDIFKNTKWGQNFDASKIGDSLIDTFVKNDATKSSLKKVFQSFLKGGGAGGNNATGFLSQMLGSGGGGVAGAGAAGTGAAGAGAAGAGAAGAGAAGAGAAGAGAAGAGAAGAGAGAAGAGAAGAGAGVGAAGAGVAAGGMSALAMTGWGLLIIGIVYTIVKVLGPALKGLADVAVNLGKSFNKEEELRKKRAENAQKRLEADMEWIARKPFEILEEAAKKWEDTWDNNLRTIGQTQGYDKESVYALYEGYADKLREENLDSVISATDVIDKLSSVLESGLSGKAAEEFAYIATKLNNAIPGQDFFSYADTYASIAANAVAQGESQAHALDLANQQLEQFASNLLYSSRELAGGFSTGLKNGSNLFKEATQIAQAAKSNNAAAISGTLTSVSAIIGAVAPDMADSIVSNIVQAAIGGNSSQIVALRSLAGINASNTEFLRAMAEDPKSVFSALFTNLANMQNMSSDNYMEVAEGLAEVFGIDKAAFARVDFNYLAQAIDAMNVNNRSLQENMNLLISGQTTTSAEQLKAQEINSVILEEGLAYVIDSEAGRMIQQHMWDEQLKNELAANEYAVNLQGSALTFLEGIRKTVTNLLNFLNPVGFIAKGIANMTATIAQAVGNDQDLKEILKLQAVGSNATAYNNLTTRGKDLKLTTSLVEMLGGTRGVAALNNVASIVRVAGNVGANLSMLSATGMMIPTADEFNMINDLTRGNSPTFIGGLLNRANELSSSGSIGRARSSYSWGLVGKSAAKALQNTRSNTNIIASVARDAVSAAQSAQETANKKFQEFLDTAPEASKSMGWEHWVATAKDFGISDFAEALKQYGKTEEEVRAYFEANQAQEGAKQEMARKEDEQTFRDENRAFWDYAGGTSGVFQSAIWLPFFGQGQKYDTRMNAVDSALANIQFRIGTPEKHTVISGLEEISRKIGEDSTFTVISVLSQIEHEISTTFISTSSAFQRCLADWIRYIASKEDYEMGINRSSAWSELKQAEGEAQSDTLLALANALNVFSADELKKLDPQLQANALLGEIVIILQAIMQQNNSVAGGLSLMDTISALGMGMTKQV